MEKQIIAFLVTILMIITTVLPVTGKYDSDNNEFLENSTLKFIKNISHEKNSEKTNAEKIANYAYADTFDYDDSPYTNYIGNFMDCNPICIIPDTLGDTTTDTMVGGLQNTLNSYPYYNLSVIDVNADQTQYQLWNYDDGIIDVSLEFEFVGSEAGHQNVVGYYFDSDETSYVGVFEVPDGNGNDHSGYDLPVASIGDTFVINNLPISSLGKIALAIDSENGGTYKLFSENDLNPNNKDRTLVFTLCDEEYGMIYVFCFEDLKDDTHKDFNDAVFILKIIECTSCNDPPIFSNEDPANDAIDISIDLSELSVTIEDPDGDSFDWTIETSPDIGNNSGYGEYDGIKTCIISDLSYSTTYTWFVNATDTDGSGETTEEVYIFTTVLSNPPVISNPDPFDGATEVGINLIEISVTIEDPEGDSFDWSIETDPDIGSNSGSDESNGTKICSVSDLEYNTTYTWTVSATDTDGSGETTEKIYSFTTITSNPPIISDPNPDDGVSGIAITLSELNVTIEDPENDSFDWTIETSPDIGNSGGYDEYNGIKTCSVSGLEYNTTYTWYVNATDSGSGETTEEVYTFTTESEGNDRPIIINPKPPNAASWVPVTLKELSVTIEDPENDQFDWNIETIPDIGSSSGSGEHNGIKTCSVSGLEYDTNYKWVVEATDPNGSGKTRRRYYVFTTEPIPPNPPGSPEGPPSLDLGQVGKFCTKTTHPDGIKVQYRFDWDAEGSHEYSYWTNFVSSGTEICVEHSWSKAGRYVIKSIARDELGATSKWSSGLTIIIGNHPPEKPEKPWKKNRAPISFTFCTRTDDPDGDQVWYWWDWGDGSNSDWLGPYESGKAVCISHSWSDNGNYKVKVKAKDIYNFESEWSDTSQVSFNKYKIKTTSLTALFARFIYLYQILKLILLK